MGGGEDLVQVLEIQERSPQAAQWPQTHLRQVLNGQGSAKCLLAEEHGHVAGFLFYQQPAGNQIEILNLAVHPEHRRKGIGMLLLEHLRVPPVSELFLEVRAGNHAARAFYTQADFHLAGRRKAYYRQPEEDAVVMQWTGH